MSDDLMSKEMFSEENVNKVRASSAEIVVHGTKEKPYYEIEYFDLSDNEMHIGFSSYKLDVVFGYLEKYFEIVDEENKPEHSQNHIIGDLISRKSLIENLNKFAPEHYTALMNDLIMKEQTAFDKEKVIKELREELNLSDAEKERCARENPLQFDSAKGYANGIANAIEIVEKGGIE